MILEPKLIEALKSLVAIAEADEGNYFEIVQAIALIFPPGLTEQLAQLVNGPVWDGNVVSKARREELFEIGIAVRVCAAGEQGYTGAKYIGYSIIKEIRRRLPNA